MLVIILRRIAQAVVVMAVVSTISFVLFRFAGDPVHMLSDENDTLEMRSQLRERLGLNDPIVVQFERFAANALQGQFGLSYRTSRPAFGLIVSRIPVTLELVLCAAALATLIGVPMGICAAIYRNRWLGGVLQAVAILGISMPTFLLGILLIAVFSVILNILPSFGRGEVIDIGWWSTGLLTLSGIKSLILPSLTLGLFQMTMIMRLVRSEMLEVLRTDFIKFARARGLKAHTIYLEHALRSMLIPVITVLGMLLGNSIAFAIITETVFQWPGLGLLFIQSVSSVDIPVMTAYLMFTGLLFVSINLVVDLTYLLVDPRLRSRPARSPAGAGSACG